MKQIKKEFDEKSISEDQKKYREAEVDTITKSHTEKIDSSVASKSSDVLKV
jgi:ribosome recycling factor